MDPLWIHYGSMYENLAKPYEIRKGSTGSTGSTILLKNKINNIGGIGDRGVPGL